MSACQCIKCEGIVAGFEKYCDNCVRRYGVAQDVNWHRYHHFQYWDAERKIEFERDVNMAKLAGTWLNLPEEDKQEVLVYADYLKHKRKRHPSRRKLTP